MDFSNDEGKRAPETKNNSIAIDGSKENDSLIRYALRTLANKGADIKGTIEADALTVKSFDPIIGFYDKPCGDVVYKIEITAVIKQDAKTPRKPGDNRSIQGF